MRNYYFKDKFIKPVFKKKKKKSTIKPANEREDSQEFKKNGQYCIRFKIKLTCKIIKTYILFHRNKAMTESINETLQLAVKKVNPGTFDITDYKSLHRSCLRLILFFVHSHK